MRLSTKTAIAIALAASIAIPTAALAKTPTTLSKWTSITPNQGQFAGQPGHVLPLAVLNGDSPYFQAGDYMIYVAESDPEGLTVSEWETFGPVTLRAHEKWRAVLLRDSGLDMQKNTGDLTLYADPGAGHAMIFVRNEDDEHWQSICVLPVGMAVKANCFGGSNNVVFVAGDDDDDHDTPPVETVQIFSNGNIAAVYNQPTAPTDVTLSETTRIVKITNYHWNDANGSSTTGTIALLSETGELYGPWQTTGSPGQGGVPNAYWIATPDVSLPAGTYRVIDSNPATWSQNGESGGAGMTIIDGYTE